MAGKFTLKKSRNGKHRFNLVASNGQVIFTSQMYETRKAASGGIRSVRANSKNEKRFERKDSRNGKFYFVLKAGNGQEVGRSQMYKTKRGMENGIKSVMKNAPEAEMVDMTGA